MPTLLEVNPRFPGTMPLTVAAGVDMPLLAVAHALGHPLPDRVAHREVAVVRHWADVVVPLDEYAFGRIPGECVAAATASRDRHGVRPVDRPLADWHTHSDLTDGTASPQTMADAAAPAGLTRWALSDHVRASSTVAARRCPQVRGLRVDGLQVLCGVEAKILDVSGRLDLPTDLPHLDHVLVADHQFPGLDGPEYPDRVRRCSPTLRVRPRCSHSWSPPPSARGHRPFPAIVAHLFTSCRRSA